MNPRPDLLWQERYMLSLDFNFMPKAPLNRILKHYTPFVLATLLGDRNIEQPAIGPLYLLAGERNKEVLPKQLTRNYLRLVLFHIFTRIWASACSFYLHKPVESCRPLFQFGIQSGEFGMEKRILPNRLKLFSYLLSTIRTFFKILLPCKKYRAINQ